jgi:Replication-relaxation
MKTFPSAKKKTRKEVLPMPETTREKRRTGRTLTAEILAKAGAPLVEIDWRLLRWLLRYPLQRADDLVVGVARWASRATVYRHLQGLEVGELVESLVAATPGTGKRLYHLSNLGLHVLARHLERPARDLAREWQADEAGLLRLMPRLPTLLVLQEVVNGLVTGVAEAMTTQERRPRLVRWTWQRDVTHRFRYREKAMRLFVDGAIALSLRTQQSDGSTEEQWYGLFLLSTELDVERLMRLRLERLLCWRESPEHWPVYQHMLPVLILAGSLRQREHWQRAVEATALKLRMEPLAVGLAALPLFERAHVNPWLLNWHTLASEESCHLQDLLKPLPLAAFPSSLTLQACEDEDERQPHSSGESTGVSPVTGTHARLSRLIVGELAGRTASLLLDQPVEQELLAFLGLRLTTGQWGILHLLLDHPLLSDQELVAFLALQRKSVRSLLYTLHRLGCLDAIPTEAGTCWQLGERGLRLISAANHFPVRNLALVSGDETGAGTASMKQRGVDWLFQHLQHTSSIYRFFAALTEAARRASGHALCWWETGARCERRYRVGEQWYNLRPDALAEYRVGRQRFRFWLEWDRGTMNARDLAVKFTAYAHYIDSREWAREDTRLPRLVCITTDIAQEQRIQREAHKKLASFVGTVVWTTTEALLNQRGPLAPIWSRGRPPRDHAAQSSGSLRQSIFAPFPDRAVT